MDLGCVGSVGASISLSLGVCKCAATRQLFSVP